MRSRGSALARRRGARPCSWSAGRSATAAGPAPGQRGRAAARVASSRPSTGTCARRRSSGSRSRSCSSGSCATGAPQCAARLVRARAPRGADGDRRDPVPDAACRGGSCSCTSTMAATVWAALTAFVSGGLWRPRTMSRWRRSFGSIPARRSSGLCWSRPSAAGTTGDRAPRSRGPTSRARGRRSSSRRSTRRASTTSRRRARRCRSSTGTRAGSSGRRTPSCTPRFPAAAATPSSCSASSRTCAGARSAITSRSVASEFKVELVVTLGSLLADVPHTRPAPVTGSATDPELIDRLGLQASRYEGPTGIVGVLHDACGRAGIASASLWAAVPHYVSLTPSPARGEGARRPARRPARRRRRHDGARRGRRRLRSR